MEKIKKQTNTQTNSTKTNTQTAAKATKTKTQTKKETKPKTTKKETKKEIKQAQAKEAKKPAPAKETKSTKTEAPVKEPKTTKKTTKKEAKPTPAEETKTTTKKEAKPSTEKETKTTTKKQATKKTTQKQTEEKETKPTEEKETKPKTTKKTTTKTTPKEECIKVASMKDKIEITVNDETENITELLKPDSFELVSAIKEVDKYNTKTYTTIQLTDKKGEVIRTTIPIDLSYYPQDQTVSGLLALIQENDWKKILQRSSTYVPKEMQESFLAPELTIFKGKTREVINNIPAKSIVMGMNSEDFEDYVYLLHHIAVQMCKELLEQMRIVYDIDTSNINVSHVMIRNMSVLEEETENTKKEYLVIAVDMLPNHIFRINTETLEPSFLAVSCPGMQMYDYLSAISFGDKKYRNNMLKVIKKIKEKLEQNSKQTKSKPTITKATKPKTTNTKVTPTKAKDTKATTKPKTTKTTTKEIKATTTQTKATKATKAKKASVKGGKDGE